MAMNLLFLWLIYTFNAILSFMFHGKVRGFTFTINQTVRGDIVAVTYGPEG